MKIFSFGTLSCIALLSSVTFATTTRLDIAIQNLGQGITVLQTDQNLAISYLRSISNLSNGGLLTAPVISAKTGSTVDLAFSLAPSTYPISAIQADIVLSTGITISSITVGQAALATGKQLASNGNRFLIFGLNQNSIGSGVVAIAHLKIASTAIKTLYSIGLINPVFSDGNGKSVVASTTSGTVIVQ